MVDIQIQLAGIWIALMLVYLLGDVLRIFSGDVEKMGGMKEVTQPMWMGISILMLMPIIMILVSLMVDYPVNRWANIIVAAFFFLFNLIGLPGYPSAYDKFLLAVSLVFNVLTVLLAWNWVLTAA
jgi:hypothetical protein